MSEQQAKYQHYWNGVQRQLVPLHFPKEVTPSWM